MRLVGSLPRKASTVACSLVSSAARVLGTKAAVSPPFGGSIVKLSVPVWKYALSCMPQRFSAMSCGRSTDMVNQGIAWKAVSASHLCYKIVLGSSSLVLTRLDGLLTGRHDDKSGLSTEVPVQGSSLYHLQDVPG